MAVTTPAGDLREGMRRVASTVAIVTAHGREGPLGITATSVTSVSLQPPSLLVCVNRSARLHRAIAESGEFRVNYLACGQEPVASAFGSSTALDRFLTGEWRLEADHGPLLADALAQMTCTLSTAIDHGTHTIFIGGVEDVELGNGVPLVYCDGSYTSLAAPI